MVFVCPGSFDPVTLGHLGIIKRASKLCDRLIVAVLTNGDKKPVFTADERAVMLKMALPDKSNIDVVTFDGQLLDFTRLQKADGIVKGLRNVVDFEYEKQIASYYLRVSPPLETILLISDPEVSHISSSMVRQISYFGGSIEGLVPDCIIDKITEKIRSMRT